MKKKKSQSVEHIITNPIKGSTKLFFNPRLSKTKTMKSNTQSNWCGDPYPRTCPASTFSTLTVGNVNSHKQYAYNDEILADIRPWEKLRHTFSTRKSPIASLQHLSSINNRSPHPKNADIVDEFPEDEFSSVSQTTDVGVQVSLFHCNDCRRHVKYGKKIESSASETENGRKTEAEDSPGMSNQGKILKESREKMVHKCSNFIKEDNIETNNGEQTEAEVLPVNGQENVKQCKEKMVPNRSNMIKEDNVETPDIIPKGQLDVIQEAPSGIPFERKPLGFILEVFQMVCENKSPIRNFTFVLVTFLCILLVFFIIPNRQYLLTFLNMPIVEETPTFFETLCKTFSWVTKFPQTLGILAHFWQ